MSPSPGLPSWVQEWARAGKYFTPIEVVGETIVPTYPSLGTITGSGQNTPAHGSEPLSSPAPVGQSAGIWRVVAGKMYARALGLSI